MSAPSKRQRRQLKRWAKGKTIKTNEVKEFRDLGWIEWVNEPMPCGGYASYPRLTEAGREVIGVNKVTVR